ncbi:MAG: M28 family peptidase [Ignavibacteriales bacterium]|nr:M28 family peptidase [Ignavibacteriales bacterium]
MKLLLRVTSLALILLFGFKVGVLAQTSKEITAAELTKHVKFLSSDDLQGRKTGSKGAEAAAQYIAREFQSYGLKPVGPNGSFFQDFEFVSGVKLGDGNSLAFEISGKATSLLLDKEFRPLGFSSSETFAGPVVFLGYGISDTAKKYDDYASLDIKGKAVMVLRNAPPADSTRDLGQYASLRYKASKARELGARVLFVVTGPEDSETDDLIKLSYDNASGNAGLPAINITRKTADLMLADAGKTIKDLQKAIHQSKAPKSVDLPHVFVRAKTDIKEIRETARNVVGYLEGSDPELKNQMIIIGAHYDHLGMGGEGSGSLKIDTVAIHHGADDNASGTAGVLELAQAFSAMKTSLKRSMLFISFAGEELGLLGSAYYANHPLLPLDRAVAMINMDMIGRLNNRVLIVYGVGTSAGFEDLVKKHNQDSAFVLKLNKDGYGPSDHASFYGKQIPVFHFFTDIHSDYHRPSDTFDKLNYQGEEKVVRYIERIAEELDQSVDRPRYIAVEAPRQATAGRSTRVYMGTIPDFGEQVQGMKISGVREGSPAAKAGMTGGDIIIKFGKVDVKSLYDFTYALGEYKPGDEVDVVIKRGAETKSVKVKLEKRN